MKIQKAVITAAGPDQRKLPLQTLIDKDGAEKSVLEILISEVKSAGIQQVGIVIYPGDEENYKRIAGPYVDQVHFIHQKNQMGYGHAILTAFPFTGMDPFLHLVGDHLYVNRSDKGCARQLVEFAENVSCSVSAVQATRESQIPYYGVIGGARIQGTNDTYKVDKVIEKPSPTQAEQKLMVPGLRAGYYLCFFGMHVLTPGVMEILEKEFKKDDKKKPSLSSALNELSRREKYLALEISDLRFDMGARYGLMKAQLALALAGKERDRILSELLEFFMIREMDTAGR
jgi:UTP--glucose-1-phosphate uridylyltransferase